MRRIGEGVLLTAIVIFGAILRFNRLAVPSLWLDEILDYDVATKLTHEPLWHFITNGLLFLSSELAGRFVHAPELSARFAPAVFGCLALVVAVSCGLSGVGKDDFAERVTFALLLAGSPLAIYYSREARPYALLILLATAMLAALLAAVSRSRGFAVSEGADVARLLVALPLLTLLTTSGAAPLLIATAFTAGIVFLFDRRRYFAVYAAAALLAAMFVPLLYRRPGVDVAAGFRPLSARFFQRLLQSFSIGAVDTATIHRTAYVVAVLALIGVVALARRDRVRGAIVIGMAVLPIAVSLVALWKLRHW